MTVEALRCLAVLCAGRQLSKRSILATLTHALRTRKLLLAGSSAVRAGSQNCSCVTRMVRISIQATAMCISQHKQRRSPLGNSGENIRAGQGGLR